MDTVELLQRSAQVLFITLCSLLGRVMKLALAILP